MRNIWNKYAMRYCNYFNMQSCHFPTSFPLQVCIEIVDNSFPSRYHLIFVLINWEVLTVFEKKVGECDWPSAANGIVEWTLYVS